MKIKKAQTSFLLTFMLVVFVLAFFIFKPYLNALFLAAALSVVFHPLHEKILKFFNGRASLASLATLLIFFIIILAPLTFFGVQIFHQSVNVYEKITTLNTDGGFFFKATAVIEASIRNFIPDISINFRDYIGQGVEWMVQNFAKIFTRLATVLFGTFISMLAFYYFLKDGYKIKKLFIKLSPLPDKYDQAIIGRLVASINSVIKGSLTVALIQGTLVGVGFAIFGVPNSALWGSFGVMAALVPTVGTSLVLGPGILFLLFTGSFGSAIGLAIWGAVAVGLIDNFLGPRLMERGISLHPLLILLSVLGGLSFFGPVGFILGPTVLSLLFALLEIYQKEFKSLLKQND